MQRLLDIFSGLIQSHFRFCAPLLYETPRVPPSMPHTMTMQRQPMPFHDVFERIAQTIDAANDDEPTPLLIASGWVAAALLCRKTRGQAMPSACKKLIQWAMADSSIDAGCRADAKRFLLQCDQRRERVVLKGGPVVGSGTFVKTIATVALRRATDAQSATLRASRNDCRLAAGALLRSVEADEGWTDVPVPSVGARRLALSVCNMVLAESAAAADDGVSVSLLDAACVEIRETLKDLCTTADNNNEDLV